jgi:hypothetical protein
MDNEQNKDEKPVVEQKPITEAKTEKIEKEFVEKVYAGKFKTADDLEKAYAEMEKKQGEMGTELGQAREFMTVLQPLLDEIRDDPKLFAELDKRLRDKSGDKSESVSDKEGSEEVRETAADIVIARFEEKYGVDRLPDEERRELRKKIGDEVFELTGKQLTKLDLRRLPTVLDKAYFLANKEKLVEKSKLEALSEARNNNAAAIGSMPSSGGKSETTLTHEESKIASKLGLSTEQYLEGKKKSGR